MTSISYDDIFNSFLGNVTDYDLASLSPSDAYEQMCEWLRKSVADPYVRHIFSSLSLDDNTQIMSYELELSIDNEADNDFVTQVLGKQMVYEWIHPRVNKTTNLNQYFGNKEQKFYSQKEMLSELRQTEQECYVEARRLIRDHGYINNSYLGGAT